MMIISNFTSRLTQEPTHQEITWANLCAGLEKPKPVGCTLSTCKKKDCEHKRNSSAWSPVSYFPGTTRGKRNVDQVFVLALDIDQTTPEDWQSFRDSLEEQNLEYFFHTTHSHRDDVVCVRVLIPLTDPVPGSNWSEFFLAAAVHLNVPNLDTSTKDPSRLFFEPIKGVDLPFLADYVPGSPLDPSEIPVAPRASQSLSERVGERTISKGRNNYLIQFAGRLQYAGLRVDQIKDLVLEENDEVCDPPLDVDEIERTVFKSIDNYGESDDLKDFAEFSQAVDDIVAHFRSGAKPESYPQRGISVKHYDVSILEAQPLVTVPTGIKELDRHLGGGLHCSRLHTVAAAPGVGKTGFVLMLARAVQDRRPVLYWSTELLTTEIAARNAGGALGLSWQRIEQGKEDKDKIHTYYRTTEISLIGADALEGRSDSLQVIREEMKRLADDRGAPVLIVDYIQLIRTPGEQDMDAVTRVSKTLRSISQEFNTPVIAVSSVSRNYYGINKGKGVDEDDPTSYLASAKGSGSVEFDSAVYIHLETGPDTQKDETMPYKFGRAVLAKVRAGTAGFVGLRHYGASGNWVEDVRATFEMSHDMQRARRAEIMKEKSEQDLANAVKTVLSASGKPMKVEDIVNAVGMNRNAVITHLKKSRDNGDLLWFKDGTAMYHHLPGTKAEGVEPEKPEEPKTPMEVAKDLGVV